MRSRSAVVLNIKGAALVGTICALMALSIAVYGKAFSDVVEVTVEAERAGLQLSPNGDVRMRGALVGRVASLDVEGDHAVVRLQIDRDKADDIPSNVQARIVPTTLFGQKYVDLVTLEAPADEPISDGDVIPVDRSSTAVELNAVLDELEPVLSAVRPQDLSVTLEALASGLEGRGELIGENAERVAKYLHEFNPQLPLLVKDLRAFGTTADTYANAAPDLLRLLDSSTVTSKSVLALRADLRESYAELTSLANVAREFFGVNGDLMVRANGLARPVLELLALYSPEFKCVFQSLNVAKVKVASIIRDHKLMLSAAPGKEMAPYTASDHPANGDIGIGPRCGLLPGGKYPLELPTFRNGAELEPLLPGGRQ